jgi:undecaprenyl-diphosphatase
MILKAIILGIIQGLTEFLPISSSGHLAIVEKYFGIAEPVILATFLHFGTFCATVVFFFKPIVSIFKGAFTGDRQRRLYIVYIIVGTIPIVLFACCLRPYIEQAFTDMRLIALFLGITGAIVLITSAVKKGSNKITFASAVIMGIAQMFASLPGISRSGFTISAGIFSKVDPREAFTFSFLLSLPAILGANIYQFASLSHIDNIPAVIVGMVCSFISGIIALKILKQLVQQWFYLFGIYCLVISIVLLLII